MMSWLYYAYIIIAQFLIYFENIIDRLEACVPRTVLMSNIVYPK